MTFAAGLPYLLIALLGATFLWGSIVAFRGRRWWATVLMLLGSGAQVLGALGMTGGMVALLSGVLSASGPGAMSGPAGSGFSAGIIVMMGGMALLGVGFVIFAAGFVGFCARSGPTEQRAAELEEMVEMLQQRMEEQG